MSYIFKADWWDIYVIKTHDSCDLYDLYIYFFFMPVKAVFSFRLNFKYPNLVFQKVFDIVPICKESINCLCPRQVNTN